MHQALEVVVPARAATGEVGVSVHLFTIGHSTRSSSELFELLHEHAIDRLVDVRRFPRSRRHPHMSGAALEPALAAVGIDYRWVEALGGRRSRRPDSPHTAWRVAGFAAYADYMDTPEFQQAATELLDWTARHRVAIMCAEARPEQCHRRLIADWATAHGATVTHIERRGRARPHQVPEFARIDNGRLIYDGNQLPLGV